MAIELGRREMLATGAAVIAVATLPGRAGTAGPIVLYDPGHAAAHNLALAKGRAVAIAGDHVHFWRDLDPRGPVHGVTRWADFVLFRGLAAEQGMRARREPEAVAGRRDLFVWTLA